MLFFASDRGNSITGVVSHRTLLVLMKCSLSVNVILILFSQETSHLWGFKTGVEWQKTMSGYMPYHYKDGNV